MESRGREREGKGGSSPTSNSSQDLRDPSRDSLHTYTLARVVSLWFSVSLLYVKCNRLWEESEKQSSRSVLSTKADKPPSSGSSAAWYQRMRRVELIFLRAYVRVEDERAREATKTSFNIEESSSYGFALTRGSEFRAGKFAMAIYKL